MQPWDTVYTRKYLNPLNNIVASMTLSMHFAFLTSATSNTYISCMQPAVILILVPLHSSGLT